MDDDHFARLLRSTLRSTSRTPSSTSISAMRSPSEPQKLRVLVAANGPKNVAQAEALVVRLSKNKKIESKCIADCMTPRLRQETIAYRNKSFRRGSGPGQDDDSAESDMERKQIAWFRQTAFELCEWADLMVLAPIDANTLAKMLHGMADDLLLEVLRGWDVSKKILLVPGMSTLMWENPMTKKQLNKIRRKWNWVRVMQPILWAYDGDHHSSKMLVEWEGFSELEDAIKNQAELMTIGHDVDIANSKAGGAARGSMKTDIVLPTELWAIILEYVGDWELSQALGIKTNIPMPPDWAQRSSFETHDEVQTYMRDLESTILCCSHSQIVTKLSQAPKNMRYLSSLCVKLIIKFCLTDLLTHLETHFKDVLWSSFGPKLLPTKASAVFGRTEVLEWWRTSPSFLSKDYGVEAMDGASKSGFVHVLDWWRKSGLPLKYSEAALEQASSQGHIQVLEWWKEAAMHGGKYHIEQDTSKFGIAGLRGTSTRGQSPGPAPNSHGSDNPVTIVTQEAVLPPLKLKVGKSIVTAAQNGRADVVRWWDESEIPYSHSEVVAKIASSCGWVNVLDTWRELKGEKMSFDSQVLVGPTKYGHADVLEWWKRASRGEWTSAGSSDGESSSAGVRTEQLRVEYKTCDIEEALEDSVGREKEEDEVRKWWTQNGLNLGVGTSEWMKVKVL